MSADLIWRPISSRREARVLQNFTCTSDFPRTPGGRTLPHERLWEWNVQAHLRELCHNLAPLDTVIAGYLDGDVIACAQMCFGVDTGTLEAFHVAAAVTRNVRGQGGGVADELLAEAKTLALARAAESACSRVHLWGKIHVANVPSQRMVARAGWEPLEMPLTDYQRWGADIPIR